MKKIAFWSVWVNPALGGCADRCGRSKVGSAKLIPIVTSWDKSAKSETAWKPRIGRAGKGERGFKRLLLGTFL